jgi:predicted negative regulator of RcsB-dependent stress response
MDWIVEIAMTIVAAIVLIAGVVAYWRQWREADAEQRQIILAKAVKELVNDAEQQYVRPKSGPAKLSWVMGKLGERFPDVEWAELAACVEAAVTHLHHEKAMRSVRHRNGRHDE